MRHTINIVRLKSGAYALRGEVPKNWDRMVFLSWEHAFRQARKLDSREYHICKHKRIAFAA